MQDAASILKVPSPVTSLYNPKGQTLTVTLNEEDLLVTLTKQESLDHIAQNLQQSYPGSLTRHRDLALSCQRGVGSTLTFVSWQRYFT